MNEMFASNFVCHSMYFLYFFFHVKYKKCICFSLFGKGGKKFQQKSNACLLVQKLELGLRILLDMAQQEIDAELKQLPGSGNLCSQGTC